MTFVDFYLFFFLVIGVIFSHFLTFSFWAKFIFTFFFVYLSFFFFFFFFFSFSRKSVPVAPPRSELAMFLSRLPSTLFQKTPLEPIELPLQPQSFKILFWSFSLFLFLILLSFYLFLPAEFLFDFFSIIFYFLLYTCPQFPFRTSCCRCLFRGVFFLWFFGVFLLSLLLIHFSFSYSHHFV